jgi:predicted dehydrogenase
VAAIADVSVRGRADAREAFGPGVPIAGSFDELLNAQLDAILILTPDFLHEDQAVLSLEAGLPTFLEKPMAITTEGADRVLETAHRTGSRIYVGHNMRHLPVIVAMRDLVREGAIGEVKAIWCRHFVSAGGDYYFKDWHAVRGNTTGLLLQKGAHDIDVIHWLAGSYTARASAIGALSVYGDVASRKDNSDRRMRDWYSRDNWPPLEQTDLAPEINVEDISMANFVLANGVLASYQQCQFTPDYWRNYTVIGTEGRLENFGDTQDAVVKVWTTRTDAYTDQPDRVVEVSSASGGHGGADPLLIAEFLRFVRDGGETLASPLAARHAVAAAVAATSSLRSGGTPIDVPPVRPEIEAYFLARQVRR